MLKRRVRRKLMAVGAVLFVMFVFLVANAGAGWGRKAAWCWPWWNC